ncbi:MAG: DUF2723 domain-containing protein [Candidatus Zixiibacteriota bacterium]
MHKQLIITGGAVFLLAFGVYLFTMCPTIYWEDSAAFCAVHSFLGIPHSPGFPIYVIWGRLFTMLPVSCSAFSSNLMSAFWGSLALSLLYLLITEIFSQIQLSHRLLRLSTSVGVLLLAFTSSFWLQTVRAEVYTLNIFLTLLLIYLAVKWRSYRESPPGSKILLLFSYVFGLSLTNHPLLAITLAPAFLFFFWSDVRMFLSKWKRLLLSAMLFGLGASLYLYLPIRSSLSPLVNWGKPDTLSGLWSYLLRTSQPSAPTSSAGFPYLNRFWFSLSFPVDQFSLALFWLGVVGATVLFRFSRRMFFFTFSILILNVLTATWATDFSLRNYDLLGYLLPSLSMFAIWLTLGLNAVLRWMSGAIESVQGQPHDQGRKVLGFVGRSAPYGLLLILPLFQIWRNFDQCNKRPQIWADTYASQILNSVKKDALILIGDDNTLTSLWYLNLAQGMRPDVTVLSISALTQKSYREHLGRQYRGLRLPDITTTDLGEIAYQVSELNAEDHPVYATYFSTHAPFAQHLRPAGYLFEFCPDKVIPIDKDIEGENDLLRKDLQNGNLDLLAREHFGNLIFNLGAFYDHSGIGSRSLECFLWALEIDPSNPRIYFQLGKAFLRNGDKVRASDFLQAGLELDPYNLEARKLLEKT